MAPVVCFVQKLVTTWWIEYRSINSFATYDAFNSWSIAPTSISFNEKKLRNKFSLARNETSNTSFDGERIPRSHFEMSNLKLTLQKTFRFSSQHYILLRHLVVTYKIYMRKGWRFVWFKIIFFVYQDKIIY